MTRNITFDIFFLVDQIINVKRGENFFNVQLTSATFPIVVVELINVARATEIIFNLCFFFGSDYGVYRCFLGPFYIGLTI